MSIHSEGFHLIILIPPSILNVEFNTPIYPKTAENPVNPPFLPKNVVYSVSVS